MSDTIFHIIYFVKNRGNRLNNIMQKVNLLNLVSNKSEYTNFVVSEINDYVLRIAVIEGEFHLA